MAKKITALINISEGGETEANTTTASDKLGTVKKIYRCPEASGQGFRSTCPCKPGCKDTTIPCWGWWKSLMYSVFYGRLILKL